MRKFKFIETLAHYLPIWQPRHVSRNMIPSTTNLDVLCGVQSRLLGGLVPRSSVVGGITIKPPSAVSLSFSSIGEKSGAANLAPDYPNKSGAAKNPATDDDEDRDLPL